MYFETVVNYWTDNPDGFKPPRTQVKRHLLVRGYTYTEAEAMSIEWGNEETEEEIKISPIKELSIYTVIEDDSAGKFFKVDVLYPEETPKGKNQNAKGLFNGPICVRCGSNLDCKEVFLFSSYKR